MIWQKKTELLRSDLEVKLLPNILQMLKSIEVRSMSLRIGGYKWAGRQKSLRDKNIIKYKGGQIEGTHVDLPLPKCPNVFLHVYIYSMLAPVGWYVPYIYTYVLPKSQHSSSNVADSVPYQ